MPRAVFFDMDDTLLDTSGGLEVAWEIACRDLAPELGCEWELIRAAIRREAREFWRDEAAVGQWRTRLVEARMNTVRSALAAEGLDVELAPRLSDRYAEEVTPRIHLFDDALATLEGLRAQGFRLAIITNGPADMQRGKVERFGLEAYVDAIVIEGVFGHGKPDKEVFEHALAATGVEPHEAWHVGDNLYADIGGAKNAGLHAVWIHRDRMELGEGLVAVPDRVIAHLGELVEALAAESPLAGGR
ncbi:MAG: HAD family hydrolase [Chloroflexi bacterium]|nr:HAD family hydrolase [Chloroflexota bacterium]